MGRIGEKLKCRRGASILLALLFLLVSVLVAMSVLMAAASNAGKIRSNREEQQKYFTLSSALNLVIAELEKAEYQGQYKIIKTEIPAVMDDAVPPNVVTPAYNQYSGTQEKGNFTCGLGNSLPLGNDLDIFFGSGAIPPTLTAPDQWVNWTKQSDGTTLETAPYVLEVNMDVPPEGAERLKQVVKITVTFSNSTGNITLLAELKDETYISMEARLTAKKSSDFFQLEDTEGSHTTTPIKWELERIEKKEATTP